MTSLTWDRHRGHACTYGVSANGYNYRLDELHAALGREQLKKLSGNNERRRRLLHSYKNVLVSLNEWIMPFGECINASSGYLMVVVVPSDEVRCQTVTRLREAGVQSSMHYPCIADFEAFAQWRTQSLPITREFASRAITLPLYPTMSQKDPAQVCALAGVPDSIPGTL
jgi:dTDP-4-amino-4,6-dideoxygalactose transaminase